MMVAKPLFGAIPHRIAGIKSQQTKTQIEIALAAIQAARNANSLPGLVVMTSTGYLQSTMGRASAPVLFWFCDRG